MNADAPVNLAVTALLLVWLLGRQLSVRPLRERSRLALVLVVVGVVEAVSFLSDHHLSGRDVFLAGLSLLVGIALAVVRGCTVTVWQEGGRTLRKGGALTAVLWVAAIGLHLLIDAWITSGLGSATVLLYFGIVLAAQRVVLLSRARTLGAIR